MAPPALYFRPAAPLLVRCDFSLSLMAGMPDSERTAAFNEFCRIITPLGYVGATTEFPFDRLSGTYLTLNVLPFMQVPDRLSAGGWSSEALSRWGNIYHRLDSFVLWGDPAVVGIDLNTGRPACTPPVALGAYMAHEGVGHPFAPEGWGHVNGTVMDPNAPAANPNFNAAQLAAYNPWHDLLATGRRFGMYYGPDGVLHNDWHELTVTDPNWPLPVNASGWLVFAAGPAPRINTVPAGWGVIPVGVGGPKLAFDFNTRTVYHPGDSGTPTQDLGVNFTFQNGTAPTPRWGPDRIGGLHGWCVRRGDTGALWVDVAQRLVHLPA